MGFLPTGSLPWHFTLPGIYSRRFVSVSPSQSMTPPSHSDPPDSLPQAEQRIESWGEIAAYLRREIRTVQRWERNLGLPVHRLTVGKTSSVYAFRSELDRWYREREPRLLNDEPEPPGQGVDEQDDSSGAEPDNSKRKYWWIGGIAFAALAAIGLAVWLWSTPNPPRITRVPETKSPETKIADAAPAPLTKVRLFVRPFDSQADDASDKQFTDGLTEEINTQLGRLDPDRLGVIAPTSSRLLSAKSISDLETLLRVQFVLEGSVRRAGKQVRIDLQLISVKDQTPVWAESYTDNLRDILKVQDKVAGAVSQTILAKLPPPAASAPPPAIDPEGYQQYLQGRRYWAVRDIPRSVAAYQQAVAKMPGYVLGHSGLASAYLLLGQAPNDGVPAAESVPKARAEAQRALQLDSRNAEAHDVLAFIAMSYDWDFPTAEREFREAIRLEPNNPTAHQWWGQYLMARNRLAEAQAETSKALDLDPVSPIFTTARAEAYYYARDYDSTIAHSKLTLEQTPNFLLAEFWLASAYREKKMYPEAIQHFQIACQIAPDNPALLMSYGHALAVSGDKTGAERVLQQLNDLSRRRYTPAIYFAGIYTGMGDKDRAFVALEKAMLERDDRLIFLAVDPIADPLRSDARFHSVLARLGLP